MTTLRVYAFGPDWGLPTAGPFALKLLAWLECAGLPYEQVVQNNSAKGPRGKSPWAEIDGRTVADSDVIVSELAARTGFDIDAGLDPVRRARAHVWKRAFEEGFHQVLEWELFVHPAGVAWFNEMVAREAPPVIRDIVANRVRAHFRKQLHARGIGRHAPETVAAIGRADIDALAAELGAARYLGGDRLCLADLAVFGQVAPLVRWPMPTPVADHAKAQAPVVRFVDDIAAHCFVRASAAA